MAVRTDSTLVEAIIEVDTDITLTPFIQAANLLVNRVVVPAKDSDGELYYDEDNDTDDAEALEIIERWLSAHFYAIRDPRPVFQAVTNIMDRFQTKVDLNLMVTHYGQQAMVLDTSGELAAYNGSLTNKPMRRRVGVTFVGKPPEEDDDE